MQLVEVAQSPFSSFIHPLSALFCGSPQELATNLDLETPRPPPPSRPLKFPPLALHIRLLPRMRPESEMLDGLPSILWSSQ